MLDIHQVVLVVGLAKKCVEAQAAGRVDAALDQLDDVALAALQDPRIRVRQLVVVGDPADPQADAR